MNNTQPNQSTILTEVTDVNDDAEQSPGKRLSNARKQAGMTQQDVADKLHLRLKSVRAIEQDAIEQGISITFNKGYVRLYAKLFNLDVEGILEDYDKIHSNETQPAKLQSFSRRVTREAQDHRWNMVTVAIVVILLGSIVVWWVQRPNTLDNSQSFVSKTFDNLFGEEQQNAQNDAKNAKNNDSSATQLPVKLPPNTFSAVEPQPAEIAPVQDDNLQNETTGQTETLSEDNSQSLPSSQQTELVLERVNDANTADPQESTPTDLTINEQSLSNTDVFTSEIGSSNSSFVFTFADDCWVRVTDANGEIMAVGVKKQGYVMRVEGQTPVTIKLGAPQSVAITMDGDSVDMSVYPAGRTATFQLPVSAEQEGE